MKELLTKMKDLISQPIPVNEFLDKNSDNKQINKFNRHFDSYRYGITMVFPLYVANQISPLANYLNVNPDIKILRLKIENADFFSQSGGSVDTLMSTLAGCRNLTTLDMSYYGLLPFTVNQGLVDLAHNQSLISLELPRLIDEKSNLAILEKNTYLKTLKLTGNDDQPVMVNNKVRILSNHSSVENFDFSRCVMNAEGISPFSKNHVLKSLNLLDTHIGDDGADILSTHPTLTRLNLSLCNISKAGVAVLMKNHVMRELILKVNPIDDEGARLLSTHPSLTKLNLFGCKITDKGAGFLMENHVLTDLNLEVNRLLSDVGARLLSTHRTLTCLNLAFCRIGLTGAAHFLQNTVLRSLNLSHIFPTQSASNILGNRLAVDFSKHPTLTKLSLKGCHIDDDGAIALASNTRLTWLNLMDNPIGFLGAIALARNESLKTLKVSIADEKQLGWLFLLGNQNLESLTIRYPQNQHPNHQVYQFCSAVKHHQGLNRLTIRNASLQMEQDQKFNEVLLEYLPIPNVLTGIVFDYTKRGYSYPYDYGLFCRSLTPKIKKQINKELPQIRESLNRFALTQI